MNLNEFLCKKRVPMLKYRNGEAVVLKGAPPRRDVWRMDMSLPSFFCLCWVNDTNVLLGSKLGSLRRQGTRQLRQDQARASGIEVCGRAEDQTMGLGHKI